MKNNHLILIISFLLILFSVDGFGQRWKLRRYEVGLGIGTTHYHGDIGPAHKEFKTFLMSARPSASFDIRFKISPSFAAKLDLGYVNFSGKDQPEDSHAYYSFVANGFEHTVRGEYYILGEGRSFGSQANYNRRGMVNNFNKVYLYAYAGLGGLYSKAKVTDLETNEPLPEGSPGYNNNSNYAFVIPLGAGIKYTFDAQWSIGAELGYRWTTSDLIDGFASVYSKYNDVYFTTSFKAIYKIRNNRKGRPILRKYPR